METRTAKLKEISEKSYLFLSNKSDGYKIPLTEDNSKAIKDVFNQLIDDLKTGCFKYEYEETSGNLYEQICKEYVIQLNRELGTIYKELTENEMTNG